MGKFSRSRREGALVEKPEPRVRSDLLGVGEGRAS